MKKIRRITIILGIVLICSSCAITPINNSNNTRTTSAPIIAQNLFEANPLDNSYEDESISFVTSSIDQLKDEIGLAKTGEINYPDVKLEDIDSFYLPINVPANYSLYKIEVNKYQIFYYYLTNEMINSDKKVLLSDCITIAFARNIDSKGNPLQSVIEQTGITPNKDGVIIDPDDNYVYWAVDGTRGHIYFPETIPQRSELVNWCNTQKINITAFTK